MRISHSFTFVDVHCDETDDSEVRLVRTCSRWKCLRGPLPAARTCSPRSRVRLRGPAHFGGETCARKGSMDRKQMLHTSLCTKAVQSCYRCRLFKLRNDAPFYTLSGAPNCAFHYEVPYEIPYRILVYCRIFFIQVGTLSIRFGTPLDKGKVPRYPRQTSRHSQVLNSFHYIMKRNHLYSL